MYRARTVARLDRILETSRTDAECYCLLNAVDAAFRLEFIAMSGMGEDQVRGADNEADGKNRTG